jgi:Tol biopolymer transport system component
VKADLSGVAPAVLRLYCADAGGAAFAVPTNFPPLPAQLGALGLSPDGTTIAFSADTTTAGAYEIYTMKSDDSAPASRVTSGTLAAPATGFRGPVFNLPLAFSPDGTAIAFVADWLIDNKNELFVVPANGSAPEKRIALVGNATDADRDVQTFTWSPDGTTLALVCDHRVNNNFELFRLPNATSADQAPILVRGVTGSGDVTELAWRP